MKPQDKGTHIPLIILICLTVLVGIYSFTEPKKVDIAVQVITTQDVADVININATKGLHLKQVIQTDFDGLHAVPEKGMVLIFEK